MIERIWFSNTGLYILLLPLSFLYGLISFIRRIIYKIIPSNQWKAPIPVIVIGNLTIGGNGKTPLVIWLTKALIKEGYQVGVVSRGYRGKSKKYPLILNKNTTTTTAGDEAVLIFKRTNVPVAIAPKRSKAIQALLNKYNLDIIITDDGLQHYSLHRDYEIIVIDGKRRFGNGWWIPAGPMRERVHRLTSANTLILNGGRPQGKEILMSLEGDIAVNLYSGKTCNVINLKSVVAMAGIGYPNRFFVSLENKGLFLIKTYAFSDHKPYKVQQLISLTKKNEILLMTEKDAIKCYEFAQSNWWYLPVNVKLNKQKSKFIINEIKKVIVNNKKIIL
ncbi:Tetraacyldisaccharide 4'-kinase [Candidatus Providencia siddallii]|uniref:Tetraacyldisaccharide 4'-kinase n=1 Tax=Candidatus Providencia siddallii TaxID=1715285 RepID=A0A0M6W8A8_9GAMM|nr:Tetraacyldisaccharide 4'-kinase [Candidatus Providencia siddallii]